jgi:hypothetical protein
MTPELLAAAITAGTYLTLVSQQITTTKWAFGFPTPEPNQLVKNI